MDDWTWSSFHISTEEFWLRRGRSSSPLEPRTQLLGGIEMANLNQMIAITKAVPTADNSIDGELNDHNFVRTSGDETHKLVILSAKKSISWYLIFLSHWWCKNVNNLVENTLFCYFINNEGTSSWSACKAAAEIGREWMSWTVINSAKGEHRQLCVESFFWTRQDTPLQIIYPHVCLQHTVT